MKNQLQKLMLFGSVALALSANSYASNVFSGYVEMTDRSGSVSSPSGFVYSKLHRCLAPNSHEAKRLGDLHLVKLSGHVLWDREAKSLQDVSHPYGVLAQLAAI